MRFAIVASQRTGSSHLAAQLGLHPEIWMHGEPFNRRDVALQWRNGRPSAGLLRELRALRQDNVGEYLRRLFELNFERPHVGLKILQKQNERALGLLLQDASVLKLVLYRPNGLARYASLLAANASGAWSLAAMKRTSAPKVTFEAKPFLRHHKAYQEFYGGVLRRLNGSGQPFLFVRHDEINSVELLEETVRFIGAAPRQLKLEAREGVRAPSDILSRFSNPEAAEGFLKQRGLLHWAYEGDISFAPIE